MKVFLIILFSIFGLLFLIFLLTLLLIRIRILYDGDLRVKIGVLFFEYTLFPKKTKLKKTESAGKKKKKRKTGPQKRSAEEIGEKKEKKSFSEMIGFYTDLTKEVLLPFAEKVGKKLHVTVRKMQIVIATEDAGKTAVLYGLAVSGLSMLFELLRSTVILKVGKDRDIGVRAGFDVTETVCMGDVRIALRPITVIAAALPALMKYLSLKQSYQSSNTSGNVSTGISGRESEEKICQTPSKTN